MLRKLQAFQISSFWKDPLRESPWATLVIGIPSRDNSGALTTSITPTTRWNDNESVPELTVKNRISGTASLQTGLFYTVQPDQWGDVFFAREPFLGIGRKGKSGDVAGVVFNIFFRFVFTGKATTPGLPLETVDRFAFCRIVLLVANELGTKRASSRSSSFWGDCQPGSFLTLKRHLANNGLKSGRKSLPCKKTKKMLQSSNCTVKVRPVRFTGKKSVA